MIARDCSHPCIVAWVPFNESWGVPDLPDSPAERHYVQALYHLTKTLDPTRPVIGNDGWESVATDIIGIHDYDADPERIARRYHAERRAAAAASSASARAAALLAARRPARTPDQPSMLTEFGGIAFSRGTAAPGATRGPRRRTSSPSATPSCSAVVRVAAAASPGSATRSSPTPTRRRTGCSTPTARPSSRSRRSPPRRAAKARRAEERLVTAVGLGTRHEPDAPPFDDD